MRLAPPLRALAALTLALALLSPDRAEAQSAPTAEALFRKGHTLFEAKRYAEACPLFAESFRLDPVSGALLALASCHEAEGKLASAWAEYVEVATRADREGRKERAAAARQRSALLSPKLARLEITLARESAPLPGLVVKRDGVVVESSALGAPVPVDRGEHLIEASAPERRAFTQRVTVQDGTLHTVSIPALLLLEPPPAPVPPPAAPQAPAPRPSKPDEPAEPAPAAATAEPVSSGSPLRTVGFVTAAAGVVVGGIGGVFGVRAIMLDEESRSSGHCNASHVCDSVGRATRLEALSAGNVSTVLFVVGGALTTGGVLLAVFGGRTAPGEPPPKSARATVLPTFGGGGAGLSLEGSF